jgi:hypothetical protein
MGFSRRHGEQGKADVARAGGLIEAEKEEKRREEKRGEERRGEEKRREVK